MSLCRCDGPGVRFSERRLVLLTEIQRQARRFQVESLALYIEHSQKDIPYPAMCLFDLVREQGAFADVRGGLCPGGRGLPVSLNTTQGR